MSNIMKSSETLNTLDRKTDLPQDPLDPVLEVNEPDLSVCELFDEPPEEKYYVEIPPRILGKKVIKDGLTIESLKNAIYELGVVDLCWPEIEEPVFENRTSFPVSYYTNTNKERLLLAYAENFRRQFLVHYKMRKPLLLQAPNECGLQKMVCTSIRPTKLCFEDTNTWQGVSSLVADFFNYEPLEKPMLHPERILSPYTVIIRRSGNPFELAHVAVSWLIGAHYDAYVVVGCAKRDLCMNIRYRTECPEIPDENAVEEEEDKEVEEPKYHLVNLPDLTSKYCKEMDQKALDKIQEEKDKLREERMKKIEELEKCPPDDIDGWRTHAWIIILPGPMGIEEPFFIEPSQGNAFPLDCKSYQYIESIYNNENYYANLQNCEEGLENISYDLCDLSKWEHLLAGEPTHRRQLVGVDSSEKRTAVQTEKHLDMPPSWVEKLDITTDEFEQRYPGSHKTIHYKKVLLEKFAPYSQTSGVVKKLQIFDSYSLTYPILTYEWYLNRTDKMLSVKIDHTAREAREIFASGRRDHLLKHVYSLDAPPLNVEGDRVMEFDYYARLDHLTKVECTAYTFEEFYTDREDKLVSRQIIYSEPDKNNPKRQVRDISETYARNEAKEAKDDVWQRIFHMQDNTIDILYHYAYNFVTNDTRCFIKPSTAETGGKIIFYPDKTSGYIADACRKQPRPLDIYYSLCENLNWENQTIKKIRDRETDINGYLRERYRELTDPKLFVALFDTERNEVAKKGYQELENQKAEVEERELEIEIDPLAPYLARMFGCGRGTGILTLKEASLVREQCINDFKAKQMARQLLVQQRFDTLNSEYKAKRLWYLANQFVLTAEKESAYFLASAELAFKVHALEVRLTRHKDLSAPRFRILEDLLNKHPLLVEYTRVKSYYRKASIS